LAARLNSLLHELSRRIEEQDGRTEDQGRRLADQERRIAELENSRPDGPGTLAACLTALDACRSQLAKSATRQEVEELARAFAEISSTLVAVAAVLELPLPPT
jgi:chromosome segregation ATPase